METVMVRMWQGPPYLQELLLVDHVDHFHPCHSEAMQGDGLGDGLGREVGGGAQEQIWAQQRTQWWSLR